MRRRALIALGIFLALGAGAAGLLLLRPSCLILEYTGFYCAGCGTQRMVLALLRGDLKSAAGLNIFMLAALPAAGIYAAIEAVQSQGVCAGFAGRTGGSGGVYPAAQPARASLAGPSLKKMLPFFENIEICAIWHLTSRVHNSIIEIAHTGPVVILDAENSFNP